LILDVKEENISDETWESPMHLVDTIKVEVKSECPPQEDYDVPVPPNPKQIRPRLKLTFGKWKKQKEQARRLCAIKPKVSTEHFSGKVPIPRQNKIALSAINFESSALQRLRKRHLNPSGPGFSHPTATLPPTYNAFSMVSTTLHPLQSSSFASYDKVQYSFPSNLSAASTDIITKSCSEVQMTENSMPGSVPSNTEKMSSGGRTLRKLLPKPT